MMDSLFNSPAASAMRDQLRARSRDDARKFVTLYKEDREEFGLDRADSAVVRVVLDMPRDALVGLVLGLVHKAAGE